MQCPSYLLEVKMENLATLNSLWIGPRLPELCQLCLVSAMAVGHKVRLFAYDKVEGVPHGVEVVSADEILPRESIELHRKTGSAAFFSDRFRMTLISKGLGIWTDTDVLYLKPIQAGTRNIFAWEDSKLVGTAVLGFDHSTPAFAKLLDMAMDPHLVPPWHGRGSRSWLTFRKFIRYPQRTSNLPWGVIGPNLVTWWALNAGLTEAIRPSHVFYPVNASGRGDVFRAHKREAVLALLSKETVGIHLWYQSLLGGIDVVPASQSVLPAVEHRSFMHHMALQLGQSHLFQVIMGGERF